MSKVYLVKELENGFKTVKGNPKDYDSNKWEIFQEKSKFDQRINELENKYGDV